MRLMVSYFFISILFSAPTPTEWTVSKKSVKMGEGSITALVFVKDKRKQIYTPTQKSLWVLDIKEEKIESKKYFITGWSNGGRNILFRIFDPEVSVDPICDAITFAESTRLRVEKGVLQIFVVPDQPAGEKAKQKPFWKTCRKL